MQGAQVWSLVREIKIPHVVRCSQIKKSQRHQGGMTMRKGHVRIQQETATCKPRRKASGETNLPMPWPWTSSLQTCRKMNFCCLVPPSVVFYYGSLRRLIQHFSPSFITFLFTFLFPFLSCCYRIIKLFVCLLAQLLQSCPTLCDPRDHSPPGSSVRGILQARILEWVAMPTSWGSCQIRDWICVSCMAGGFFTNEPPRKPPNSVY